MEMILTQDKIDKKIIDIVLRSVSKDEETQTDINFLVKYIRQLENKLFSVKLQTRGEVTKHIIEIIKILHDYACRDDPNSLKCSCYGDIISFLQKEFKVDDDKNELHHDNGNIKA